MISIDPSRCIGCGLCVEDCVAETLSLSGGKATVTGSVCLHCGHCIAICPQKAVADPTLSMEEVIPYQKASFSVDADHFLHMIRFRRSCRKFNPLPLTEEELHRLLEAGRYTPTGSNLQQVRYILFETPSVVEELRRTVWESLKDYSAQKSPAMYRKAEEFLSGKAEKDRLFFGAPAILFVIAPAPIDGGLAACSIELMANAMGLGALYSGFTVRGVTHRPGAFGDLAPMEEGEQLCACLLLGHTDTKYRRTVPRQPVNLQRK